MDDKKKIIIICKRCKRNLLFGENVYLDENTGKCVGCVHCLKPKKALLYYKELDEQIPCDICGTGEYISDMVKVEYDEKGEHKTDYICLSCDNEMRSQ